MRTLWNMLLLTLAGSAATTLKAEQTHEAPAAPVVFPSPTAPTDLATLSLTLGDLKTLRVPSIRRIAVGNGKVINATAVSPTEVLVMAESPGTATLSIWDKQGIEHRHLFRVQLEDASRRLRELGSLLNGIPNISMRVVGEKIVVEGENISTGTQEKLAALARQFPALVDMTSRMTWEKMILIDVRIVEFNKQALRDLGIDWSTSAPGPAGGYAREWVNNPLYRVGDGAPLLPYSGDGFKTPLLHEAGYFGIATAISSHINLLAQDGKAIILAEPKLSTRSGSEAHFLAGGEIPLPVRGTSGDLNVFYKEYGIILDIRPESGSDGTIRATVKAEVSAIDPAVTVGGYPGFLKRQTHTEVNLRENETLVIAGLVSSEMSKDISKVPALGDMPILGALFRSKNFRDKQTELVFFLTPRVIDAHSEFNQSMRRETDSRLKYKDAGRGRSRGR